MTTNKKLYKAAKIAAANDNGSKTGKLKKKHLNRMKNKAQQ